MTKTKQREKAADEPMFPPELVRYALIGKLSIHINTSEPDREFTRFARFIAEAIKAVERGDMAALRRIARKSRNRAYVEIMRRAIEGAARNPKNTSRELADSVLETLFQYSTEYASAYRVWDERVGYWEKDKLAPHGVNNGKSSEETAKVVGISTRKALDK